jgi:hypothetical protein
MPGSISHRGFVAEDGERVTIVELESDEALHGNAGSACGRWTSHASSRGDGSLIVTAELIDLHRRLAHEMRNAAMRAAAVRIMRGLRRFFCDRKADHRRPATDAGKRAARER